jgi:hypothetical protein
VVGFVTEGVCERFGWVVVSNGVAGPVQQGVKLAQRERTAGFVEKGQADGA